MQETDQDQDGFDALTIALIGFGEAGQAFTQGWVEADINPDLRAFDIKTQSSSNSIVAEKRADYARMNVKGCETSGQALSNAKAVFSVVTADQAYEVARTAAASIEEGAYFFDCNSCAPGSKRRSAEIIEAAGGRYVDTAVMAPVHPKLHQTPMLIAGPHCDRAVAFLNITLHMAAKSAGRKVGDASSIKMVRSVLMKGLEAVILECVLSGRRAGVDDIVLQSLEQTYPGFDWKKRAAYMMERAATHGIRRAAEMREVANTVRELGFDGTMSDATAGWEQRMGNLKVDRSAFDINDYGTIADALLDALDSEAISKASGEEER